VAPQLLDHSRSGPALSRHYTWSVILHGKHKNSSTARPCPRSLPNEALQPPDGTVVYALDSPFHPVPWKATPGDGGCSGSRVLPDRPRGKRKCGCLDAEPGVGGDFASLPPGSLYRT